MNKNLRKAMISAICMLIVGVMSLTGVTYAWFTSSTTATVDGVDVSVVSVDGGIMLDNGDDDWKFTLTAVDQNGANPAKEPVSAAKVLDANKKLTFYTAEISDPDNDAVITTTLDTENYFFTEFRMKNPNATAATVTLNGSVTPANALVRNAVRWAIVDKDTGDNGTVYFFAGNSNDNIDGDEDYLAVKAAAANFDSTITGENVEYVALNSLNDFRVVVDPVEYDADGNETAVHARSFALYAWLEGNDADCNNALAGSNFSVNLVFNTELAPAADAE